MPAARKKPLQLHHIEDMCAAMLSAGMDHEAQTHLGQMLVAHGSMLRTGEHVGRADGTPSLAVGHVQFVTASETEAVSREACVGARLTLMSTKTGIGKPAPQTVLVANRPGRFNPLDAVWNSAHRPGVQPADPLFANADGSAVSRNQFIARTRTWLVAAGVVNAAEFAGHSFRAGGTCDAFDSGIPWDMVIQQGRWTSDAWKSYRRSTAFVLRRWSDIRSETDRIAEMLAGPPPRLRLSASTGADPAMASGVATAAPPAVVHVPLPAAPRLGGVKRTREEPDAPLRWAYALGDSVSRGAYTGQVIELTQFGGSPAYVVQYPSGDGDSEECLESELKAFAPEGGRLRRGIEKYSP